MRRAVNLTAAISSRSHVVLGRELIQETQFECASSICAGVIAARLACAGKGTISGFGCVDCMYVAMSARMVSLSLSVISFKGPVTEYYVMLPWYAGMADATSARLTVPVAILACSAVD